MARTIAIAKLPTLLTGSPTPGVISGESERPLTACPLPLFDNGSLLVGPILDLELCCCLFLKLMSGDRFYGSCAQNTRLGFH